MMDNFEPLVSGSRLPLVMAGPCSAESAEQVLATALGVKDAGARVFRAGLWKPRTKPGGFEGVGAAGLPWLLKAKEATGLLLATEVATPEHVRLVLQAGVDMVWLGARTVADPFAVQAIADALEGHTATAVLVKNPVNPDLELWVGALERLYRAGVRRLGAVHRGFSAYGEHTYRNPPQWAIPFELRRRYPHLPLLCDPSHIAGEAAKVGPLAQEALDMGFDGLIIETHVDPWAAMSDAAQQLTPGRLRDLLQHLRTRPCQGDPEDEALRLMRLKIDALDQELLSVLKRRMEVAREIGHFKQQRSMPVVQIGRHDHVMQSRLEQASQLGLNPEFMGRLLRLIHQESVNQQLQLPQE